MERMTFDEGLALFEEFAKKADSENVSSDTLVMDRDTFMAAMLKRNLVKVPTYEEVES
jgi:hypothetical protein